MAERATVPPGRAGRLWLRGRLSAARRAGELMDRKVRVLRASRDVYARRAEAAEREWRRAARAADTWLVRAAMLGGERELRLGAAARPAEVRLRWDTVMGVRCPVEADCALPEPVPGDRTPGTAALVDAAAACRDAVRAAAAAAAAAATLAALDRELNRSRRLLRAITAGRIPRLEAALRDVEAQLEEAERAELMRLRRALDRAAPIS